MTKEPYDWEQAEYETFGPHTLNPWAGPQPFRYPWYVTLGTLAVIIAVIYWLSIS